MKRIRILILLLLSVQTSNSQTWAWVKSCGGGGDGVSICTDPADNVFITGLYEGTMTAGIYTLGCSLPGGCTYLIKYDNNGNVLWARSPLSPCVPSFTFENIGISVCSDASGNALVTGPCFNNPSPYTYVPNTFLIKYDPSGTVLWAQSSADTSYNSPYSVTCDANNNIYVSGVFRTSVVFGTTTLTGVGTKNLFLVKFDPNGNVIWAKGNSSGDVNEDPLGQVGISISAQTNGDVFITGSFTSPSLVLGTYTLTNSGSRNIFLAKYDSNGNVLWATSASGTGADQAFSVSADGIGNVYITGLFSSPTLSFGAHSINAYPNMFLAKYDGNGNNLWAKNSTNNIYQSPIGYSVSSNSISVFVAGTTYSLLIIGSNTFAPATPSAASVTFIAKFDVNGNLLYGQVLDDGGDDWFTVCADKFCNAYVTGDFQRATFILGSNTLTSIPSTAENTFAAKLSFPALCTAGINEIHNSTNTNRLYPNPNSGLFNLQIENKIEDGDLILYNSLGQRVHQQKIVQGANEIRTIRLPSGLYHYAILQNKEISGAGNMIIEW